MITIEELEKLYNEYGELIKVNDKLYDTLCFELVDLMVKYEDVARWYISKGIGYQILYKKVIYLSEDDINIYYWLPDSLHQVRIFNKKEKQDRGVYNTLIFVRDGNFPNARNNLRALDTAISEMLTSIKLENEDLQSILD